MAHEEPCNKSQNYMDVLEFYFDLTLKKKHEKIVNVINIIKAELLYIDSDYFDLCDSTTIKNII